MSDESRNSRRLVLTTFVTWTCAAPSHREPPICARQAMSNDARGVVECSSGGDRRRSDARRSLRQMRRTQACSQHGVRSQFDKRRLVLRRGSGVGMEGTGLTSERAAVTDATPSPSLGNVGRGGSGIDGEVPLWRRRSPRQRSSRHPRCGAGFRGLPPPSSGRSQARAEAALQPVVEVGDGDSCSGRSPPCAHGVRITIDCVAVR